MYVGGGIGRRGRGREMADWRLTPETTSALVSGRRALDVDGFRKYTFARGPAALPPWGGSVWVGGGGKGSRMEVWLPGRWGGVLDTSVSVNTSRGDLSIRSISDGIRTTRDFGTNQCGKAMDG